MLVTNQQIDYDLEVCLGGICPQQRAPGIPRLNFLDALPGQLSTSLKFLEPVRSKS